MGPTRRKLGHWRYAFHGRTRLQPSPSSLLPGQHKGSSAFYPMFPTTMSRLTVGPVLLQTDTWSTNLSLFLGVCHSKGKPTQLSFSEGRCGWCVCMCMSECAHTCVHLCERTHPCLCGGQMSGVYCYPLDLLTFFETNFRWTRAIRLY